MNMNSNYAQAHKREPKKNVNFRLEQAHIDFIELNHPHNKTAFYVEAVESAIKRAKKRMIKEGKL